MPSNLGRATRDCILSSSHRPSCRQKVGLHSYEIYVETLLMIRAHGNTDKHCCRSRALIWLYECNCMMQTGMFVGIQQSALGCPELPSKCTFKFSNTGIITYKTKTEFCWSETGLVIRPKFQTKSLIHVNTESKNVELTTQRSLGCH